MPVGAAGTRLDKFLADRFPRFSRRRLTRVLKEGWVEADGRPARGGTMLHGGERLKLPALDDAVEKAARRASPSPDAPPPHPHDPFSPGPAIPVLHRDEDLLVVAKPPGVPCHGGAGLGGAKTLIDLLKADVLAGFNLVHRIDRDTSGAVALVRDAARRAAVAAAFEEGDAVEKVYDAIVEGVPEPTSGTIDLPLADPGHGGKGRVDPRNGRPARTDYVVLESFGVAARVRVVPRTGRTHQIRLHFAAIGHPLLVDPLYGKRSGWRMVDPKGGAAARLSRTPLHSAELSLPHPTTGVRIVVKAPLLSDHRRALEVLRVFAAHRDASLQSRTDTSEDDARAGGPS